MVVKGATKKKLMDLGITEENAHKLADDKKWADIKELTTEDIQTIINCIYPVAEHIKGIIESASTVDNLDQTITMLEHLEDSSVFNFDMWCSKQPVLPWLESISIVPLDGEDVSDYLNNAITVYLTHQQWSYLKMYGDSVGPTQEDFEDAFWDHCEDPSCQQCEIHTIHHGIIHPIFNESGEKMDFWHQCVVDCGDKSACGKQIHWTWLKYFSKGIYFKIGQNGPMIIFEEEDIFHPDGPMIPESEEKPQPTPKKGILAKKKGEEIMNTIVGSKKRAEIILNEVQRFDESWGENSSNDFVNTLRFSKENLDMFVELLLSNLLEREAEMVFCEEAKILLLHNKETFNTTESKLRSLVQSYYSTPSDDIDSILDIVAEISDMFENLIHDRMDDDLDEGRPLGSIHRYSTVGGNRPELSNPREVLDLYLSIDNRNANRIMESPLIKAYIRYDNNEGTTVPISQKARGIHAIDSHEWAMKLFEKGKSLHISLDSAVNSTNRELLLSLNRAWSSERITTILSKGVYIRTCPATPRPGALPNVEAKTPNQFVDGVRFLGQSMLDPNHIDYDPNGCLIVQDYKHSICSGVIVKGGDTITVGPTNSGATAAEGSCITFRLNTFAQRKMKSDITALQLNDGMLYHEIEIVYPSAGLFGKTVLNNFQEGTDEKHNGKHLRIKPTMTQVRGLHTPKENLVPPPTVNGETLHIRGNIPPTMGGIVEQLTTMDVGKGSLDECLELEQMAKNGELPEGLVVYAPSGTNAAHVAGVGLDFKFPVIYGIKPQKNGTVWTEINGWVTEQPGAEPEPYDPTPFMDYFKIGVRDGDRFWSYNLAPLSQFFHNFMTAPINDPRLEAYLGGMFASWIIKASLGVAMGEFRHAIGSDRANITNHKIFVHMLLQQTLVSGADSWGVPYKNLEIIPQTDLSSREPYYSRLMYNEVGYDLLAKLTEFYTDAYDSDIVIWEDSSYGGDKYYASIKPAQDASLLILKMLQGEEIDFSAVMNAVNKLENAVHNTGFFFNKFLGDTDAFDIGTGGHSNLNSISEHWIITAPFYALFYTNYVDEPHRVAKGHDKLIHHLKYMFKQNKVSQDMVSKIDKFMTFARLSDSTVLKDRVKQYGFDVYEHWWQRLLTRGVITHQDGLCGYVECNHGTCKNTAMLMETGLTVDEINKLLSQLSEFHKSSPFSYIHEPSPLEEIKEIMMSKGERSETQSTFVETTRNITPGEKGMEEVCTNVYLFTSPEHANTVYIDLALDSIWKSIRNAIMKLENQTPAEQYLAWLDPIEWLKHSDDEEAFEGLVQIVSIRHELDALGPHKFISTKWNTSWPRWNSFMNIIRAMMLNHETKHTYTAHSLLQSLHEAGKINDKGEIII